MGVHLRALLRNAPIVHWAVDADGIITVSEGRGLDPLGRPAEQVVGQSAFELHAKSPWLLDALRRALAGEALNTVGTLAGRWYEVQYIPLSRIEPGGGGVLGFATDVTERKLAEEKRRESEESLRALSEATFEGICIHEKGKMLLVNHAMARLFGFDDAAELVGKSALDLCAPESREMVTRRILEEYGEPYEAVGLRKDGSTFQGELHGRAIRFQDRTVRVTAIRDITERKRAEELLRHAALHDPLTGLPNRALFLDRLGHVLAQSRTGVESRLFGVLLLDVDRFKNINDSLGHFVGDRLLSAIVARLVGTLRASDTLARFGGDEFTVLLEDVEDAAEAVRVAERVQEVLARPLKVDSYEIVTSASIGIVVAPVSSYAQPERVLRDADTAMYRAKAQGRARYQLFDEAMHTRVSTFLQLETDLRHAVERDEMRFHYQTIVRLADRRIAAVEALIRWDHPRKGLLAPDMFLPIAEETGLIAPIGRWTLREACRAALALRELGRSEPVVVAVNLASRQLFQPDFAGELRRLLAETGVNGADLQLEVTEGVIIEDADAAVALLSELRAMGLSLSIDDFGTGYSSLSQLHRLPVGVLKLDRSFVSRMIEHRESRELVRTIVALGHNLGVEVTAEGIETEAQLAELIAMGCEYGQGFLLARPQPLAEVLARLRLETATS
jgi:diguanylate cyclase (GGDEF)-like protein/PAS domain S-box-containing protein